MVEELFPLDLSTLRGARKELYLCQLHPRFILTEDAELSRQMRQAFWNRSQAGSVGFAFNQ